MGRAPKALAVCLTEDDEMTSGYQVPVFGIDTQGSSGARAGPS